jgi:hypothetical protein
MLNEIQQNILPKLMINQYGNETWHLNGVELHREDGPAFENVRGTKYWYLNGKLNRADGPAVECPDGRKYWYKNDKLHRVDGPAIEHANGDKCWHLEGIRYSKEEWFQKLTPEQQYNYLWNLSG